VETRSLPAAYDKRSDLFKRSVMHQRQVSLDRIDPEFWSLAMRQVRPMEDARVLCNRRSMSMFA